MTRRAIFALLILLPALACSIVQAAPIRVSLGHSNSTEADLLRRETTTYFGRMFTQPVQVTDSRPAPDVVIGTPASSPLVRAAVDGNKILLPDGRNADQGYTIRTLGKTVYVAGRSDLGVLYGLYELLERYGAYFQISGERVPSKTRFTPRKLDVRVSPVFKYRGLLPWDNFSDGMSGYDLKDFRQLIDRATRMKLNMLQFHFYPGLAYFTEVWNGKPVDPTCIGMPVDVFHTRGSVGESAFGGIKVFGPKPYIDNIGKPRAQAEAMQAMMRQVIDYAHTRGMKTVVGFELMHPVGGAFTNTDKPEGNTISPTDPRNVDLSVERFRALEKTYPNSDFYWMWQSEAQGWFGRQVGREPGAAGMRQQFARWSGDPNLAGDVDYAYLFREVANKLTAEERSRLTTGGWSVQHLFPQIDKEFPKEITFASLNSYDPPSALKTQVGSYRAAKSGRPAWMIEWWEFDGNAWFPQFRITWQEGMYRKCAEYGVEGVTLLGWKLSAIEHNVRYLSEFAWDPELDAKSFYKDYASRLYGPKAVQLADTYLAYDRLEPRTPGATPADARYMLLGAGWCSLVLPSVPGTLQGLDDPNWKRVVSQASGDICGISGQTKLYAVDTTAISKLRQLRPQMDEAGRSWADLMINRLEFRRIYLHSMIELNGSLIVYDRVARKDGFEKARVQAGIKAKTALDLAGQAIEKYAEVIRNRGDQGVIAQLNEQYYAILKQYLMSLGAAESQYATVDWTTFRINPAITFDFSSASPWAFRDGKAEAAVDTVDGRPTIRLRFGGDNVRFNSVALVSDIDLDKSPFMDFRIRTDATEPLAFMFQTEQETFQFHALNLIGNQSGYAYADRVPGGKISDGKWHRVTWNLRKLFTEQFPGQPLKLKSLILGTWENPSQPVTVEFQDFTLGARNTLN